MSTHAALLDRPKAASDWLVLKPSSGTARSQIRLLRRPVEVFLDDDQTYAEIALEPYPGDIDVI